MPPPPTTRASQLDIARSIGAGRAATARTPYVRAVSRGSRLTTVTSRVARAGSPRSTERIASSPALPHPYPPVMSTRRAPSSDAANSAMAADRPSVLFAGIVDCELLVRVHRLKMVSADDRESRAVAIAINDVANAVVMKHL